MSDSNVGDIIIINPQKIRESHIYSKWLNLYKPILEQMYYIFMKHLSYCPLDLHPILLSFDEFGDFVYRNSSKILTYV